MVFLEKSLILIPISQKFSKRSTNSLDLNLQSKKNYPFKRYIFPYIRHFCKSISKIGQGDSLVAEFEYNTEKTVSLIYGKRKNFFGLKEVLLIQKNFFDPKK